MSNFEVFSKAVNKRIQSMEIHTLFKVDISGDELWEEYLKAFPKGADPLFRKRTEHDCSCCKNFIRNYGNVVEIIDNEVRTIWELSDDGLSHYKAVADKLNQIIKARPIVSLFVTSEKRYGAEKTYEKPIVGSIITWNHFWVDVHPRHVSVNPARLIGELDAGIGVFSRGLRTLSREAIVDVIALIESNALYRGGENLHTLKEFLQLKDTFDALPVEKKECFTWANIRQYSAQVTGIRNTSIGTLLVDLSNGRDLESSVASYEAKVAPQNYRRPTALISPRMVEDASETLEALGLANSIYRRLATISDVSVNDVLWADNRFKPKMRDGIKDLLKDVVLNDSTLRPDAFEDISIDDFVSKVLPNATSLEAMIDNAQIGNFMTVTAPAVAMSAPLFKWENNFGWSYSGNVADSVKERVKKAGGNINADVRISLGWYNYDDLDIHCASPYGHIYFADKRGILDVDMNAGGRNSREPVENLAFNKPKDGNYRIFVNQYSRRETIDVGFEIEMEFNGELHQYKYPKAVSKDVQVCTFIVKNGEVLNLKWASCMVPGGASKEHWGIKTGKFTNVVTVMNSPNHWEGSAYGSKHWFFILEHCYVNEPIRGIYNEFLRSDLNQHRKVFEILGNKTMCQPTQDQLSGVGFTAARGDYLKVAADAYNSKKFYKINF